jgi:hypothetical protein
MFIINKLSRLYEVCGTMICLHTAVRTTGIVND